MNIDLEKLLDSIFDVEAPDKKKGIDSNCMVFAQMKLEGDGVSVEIGVSELMEEFLKRELGKAYTEALNRTVKQLGGILRDFAYEIDRIGSREASEDAGKQNAGRRPL